MFLNFSNDFRTNLDLNLYTCGRESCPKKYSYGPAIRSGYIVHFIVKGKGTYKTQDKVYHLEENQAFLIEPNHLIYYEADEEDPWEYIWVGFNGVKAKEYLKRSSLSLNSPIFEIPNEKHRLVQLMNQVIEASKSKSNKDLLLTSRLYEFMYELCETYANLQITNEDKQQKYIEDAVLFIEQNYSHHVSIQDIAKHVSIDRSYLHRLFKKYLDKSPQEYLLQLRLDKACQLLSETDLRIGDISRSVGYTDVLLFSKTFKKRKNCSPLYYRKEGQSITK
ncbi:AraC family transcriptional regulator [Paenibacillus sp. Marseille-Q7038]